MKKNTILYISLSISLCHILLIQCEENIKLNNNTIVVSENNEIQEENTKPTADQASNNQDFCTQGRCTKTGYEQDLCTQDEQIMDDIFTLDTQTYEQELHRKPVTGIRKIIKQTFESLGLKIATSFITLHDWLKK